MFVELLARSSFSFLRGASHPEEIVARSKELGLEAVALCDRDGLYGSVRAFERSRELEQRVIVGAELTLDVGMTKRIGSWAKTRAKPDAVAEPPVLALLVENHEGYTNLCRLLTLAHADRPKGESALEPSALGAHARGLVAVVPAPGRPGASDTPPRELFEVVRDVFGARGVIAAHRRLDGYDRERLEWVEEAGQRFGLEIVASARPLFHHRSRKLLADVVHCIRTGTTLDRAGTALEPNAEAHLRSELEMERLFRHRLKWVERTGELAAGLRFRLDELKYRFPCQLEPGESADQKLRRLVDEGAGRRYPAGVPASVSEQLEKELRLIEKLEVAPYFLSTWEVVEIARSRRILCQGRGSAANSAVCYVLGITAVDPARSNLLFERFMSAERREPPDIDIDFEHERREEVIQEIYARYGRDRAAMVSEVICYRGKSAFREVGKAFGLSLEQVDRLSGAITRRGTAEMNDRRLLEMGFDVKDGRLRQVVALSRELEGFPRHLSIHVGGFVLSAGPLHEVAPVEPARLQDRTVVPWDKDDLEALGFFKIDVLGLGMLTAIRKCLALIHADGGLQTGGTNEPERWGALDADAAGERRADTAGELGVLGAAGGVGANEASGVYGALGANATGSVHGALSSSAAAGSLSCEPFDPIEVLTRIPAEDPAVYSMASRADTIGVFQIESRAQMAMLPRLRPRRFYDLVIEVAIVRPGPIQGGMVHPYLRRRNHEEKITLPHPDLAPILERTLGVPLFQEQVMQVAIVGAGYSGGEADQLRRDMAAWKKNDRLMRHRQRLLDGFAKNGIPRDFGEALFEQIKGFGEYGFPESHAASFALLVYSSAWQKAHYPAHFACALLNSQPMGFYSPSAIVQDAQHHGVEVRDVSIVRSSWDSTLEDASEDVSARTIFEEPRAPPMTSVQRQSSSSSWLSESGAGVSSPRGESGAGMSLPRGEQDESDAVSSCGGKSERGAGVYSRQRKSDGGMSSCGSGSDEGAYLRQRKSDGGMSSPRGELGESDAVSSCRGEWGENGSSCASKSDGAAWVYLRHRKSGEGISSQQGESSGANGERCGEPARSSPPTGGRRALRLGFRLIKGFGEATARRIEAARAEQPFDGLDDLVRRAGLRKDEVETLAEAGALEELVHGRRYALWRARAPRVGGLFERLEVREPRVWLPELRRAEQLLLDYGRKGLSIDDHPMNHLRESLRRRQVLSAAELAAAPHETHVAIAGLVTCRQQPGTASGIVFITLEDETGWANLVLYRHIFEKFRLIARHATILLARGQVERHVAARRSFDPEAPTPIVHLLVRSLERLDLPGRALPKQSRDFH